MNKFLLFSLLLLFVLLVFLIYPQTSLAAVPTVRTGSVYNIEETTVNATGTVLTTMGGGTGEAGEVGFEWGTVSGVYISTSTTYGTYATSSDFFWEISSGATCKAGGSCTLSSGTLYYLKAYATNTDGFGYGTEGTFLTKPNQAVNLSAFDKTESSISLSWTKGSGAGKTIIMYRTDQYPTVATDTDATQAFADTGTTATVSNLRANQTYFFAAWSSTTAGGLSRVSDNSSQLTIDTDPGITGGRTLVAPTVYADSLIINTGAASTQSREVTLSLKATNANLMTVCNNESLINCPLENYQQTKSWTLTEGDGLKTVYAKFVSSDGLNSAVVSDTITLKTVVEVVPVEEVPVVPPVTPPAEEVTPTPVEEALPVVTPAVEKPLAEMTIEELKAKITEVQQKIIELLNQLIQLIQEQIAALKG